MRAEAVVRDVLNQQPFVVKLQIRIVPEALRDERPELLDDELTEAAAQQPFVHAAPERLLLTRQRIELRSREIENEALLVALHRAHFRDREQRSRIGQVRLNLGVEIGRKDVLDEE